MSGPTTYSAVLWEEKLSPSISGTALRVCTSYCQLPQLHLVFVHLRYKIALDTDAKEFDGHSRVDGRSEYVAMEIPWDGRDYGCFGAGIDSCYILCS